MTQLKYFQPTTGSPVTPLTVSGSTITVPGTVTVVTGMSVIYASGNVNTTVTSIVNPNSFVVANSTGITTSTPLTIGTWVTAVVGAQGYQGTPGSPGGAQGYQGNQGGLTVPASGTTTLPPGSNATVTDSGSPGNSILYFGIPRGNQGYQGAQGYQSGVQGYQGYQGSQGYQGVQGYQSGVQGYQGYQGYQGSQGYQSGVQGAQGSQGVVYSSTSLGVPTSSIWINTSATTQSFMGPQGAQGNQGVIGTTGSQGIQGVQGPAGISNVAFSGTLPVPTNVTVTGGTSGGFPIANIVGNIAVSGFSNYLVTWNFNITTAPTTTSIITHTMTTSSIGGGPFFPPSPYLTTVVPSGQTYAFSGSWIVNPSTTSNATIYLDILKNTTGTMVINNIQISAVGLN